MVDAKMLDKMTSAPGFIAALDQSGGSTPGALRLYGISESDYQGDDEMYRLIHAMRVRIMKAPAFTGDKVIGAILVGALLVIPAAAARLLSQSLKGFFFISVLIATLSTLLGILLPIVYDLPVPSGAAIILTAGALFALAAVIRGFTPSLKGHAG